MCGNRLFVRPSLDDLASNMSQLISDSSLTAFPKDVFRPTQRQPVRYVRKSTSKNLGTISNSDDPLTVQHINNIQNRYDAILNHWTSNKLSVRFRKLSKMKRGRWKWGWNSKNVINSVYRIGKWDREIEIERNSDIDNERAFIQCINHSWAEKFW